MLTQVIYHIHVTSLHRALNIATLVLPHNRASIAMAAGWLINIYLIITISIIVYDIIIDFNRSGLDPRLEDRQGVRRVRRLPSHRGVNPTGPMGHHTPPGVFVGSLSNVLWSNFNFKSTFVALCIYLI